MRRNWDPQYGCGVMACCPDPVELRHILNAAVFALPVTDARRLRRQIGALDDLW